MKKYVVDTHALFWSVDGTLQGRSATASRCVEEARRGSAILLIPTIVLLELCVILAKKEQDYVETVNAVLSSDFVQSIPLDNRVVCEAMRLGIGRLELHDLIIVAVARLNRAAVITKDPEISGMGMVRTVW